MDKFSQNLISKLQLENSKAVDVTQRDVSESKNLANSLINSSLIKSVILRGSSVGKSHYSMDKTNMPPIKPLILEDRKTEDFTPKVQTVR